MALITDTAWKSLCRRGRAGCPTRISVCTDPGRWTTLHEPAADGRGVVDAAGRRRGRVRGPVAEQALDVADHGVRIQLPGENDRAARGIDGAVVDRAELGRRQALDGVRRAARGPAVGTRGSVERGDERLLGAAPRIGLRLEDVGQALVTQAVDLPLGECRPAQDLRQQLERGREPARRHVEPGVRRVPAGLRVQRGAEALAGLGQRDGVAQLGALGQRPRGEDGRAAEVVGLVARPGPEHHGRRDQRPARHRGHDDAQAVRERRPDRRREVVGARLAGDRALRDQLRRAHAATSPDSSAGPAAAAGT